MAWARRATLLRRSRTATNARVGSDHLCHQRVRIGKAVRAGVVAAREDQPRVLHAEPQLEGALLAIAARGHDVHRDAGIEHRALIERSERDSLTIVHVENHRTRRAPDDRDRARRAIVELFRGNCRPMRLALAATARTSLGAA